MMMMMMMMMMAMKIIIDDHDRDHRDHQHDHDGHVDHGYVNEILPCELGGARGEGCRALSTSSDVRLGSGAVNKIEVQNS